ncbi:bifunctional lysylphosphatidylglycerol synthetase/lysine--tRNA ligase LysX [Cumulibacter manganitolerans]|uniref:bifunctional lysylphosphatidylglycerol synthetase/lysine--tRNA ligase LysX n=1 Tax=Cumulibacter manganitolerans TaxID=1884992 RepID=UPI001296CE7C|nr:bifunctional lysylphosphatidylglycerol synthetase/lysine--tRNA ligase LysX [Cumulibacter manganitolerans]
MRSSSQGVASEVGRQPHSWQEGVAEGFGAIVTLGGFWCLMQVVFRGARWVQAVGEIFNFVAVPAQPNLFVGAVLILIGGALRRRLAAAYWLVIGYLLVMLVLSTVFFDYWRTTSGTEVLEAPASGGVNRWYVVELAGVVAVLAVLLAARRAFIARLAPGSQAGALGLLAGGLGTSVLVTFGLTALFPDTLQGWGEKLDWSIWRALGITFTFLTEHPAHHGHHWVATIGAVLSIGALFLAASTFLRTSRARQFMGPSDELKVRGLVGQYGEGDSLGYFATRRDKSVVFSPDGKAAVTYRVVASVSLASADPVGDRESWAAAIAAWTRDARTNGWFPAVLSASEDGARAYVQAGLKALELGDEAIIDVDEFALEGRNMRQVRQAVTRVRRSGYTLQIRRHHEIPAGEMAHLEALAEKWRGGATERGFSMAIGRLGDPADGRCLMVTAHDRDGEVRGLLSFVPWGMRGISLDLMRRDRLAVNGLNEFMVAGVLQAGHGLGIRRLSLNFAMFRSTFSEADRVGAGPITRLTSTLLSAASKVWQLETLYRSNAKYQPEWLPRYMCYDSGLSAARAMIAAGMAEGFLPAGKVPDQRRGPTRVSYGGRAMDFDDAVRRQDDELLQVAPPTRRMSQQQRVRRTKADRLRSAGMSPYPAAVSRDRSIPEVCAQFVDLPPDHRTGSVVAVGGRVRSIRDFGGLVFAAVEEDGARLQLMLDPASEGFRLWREAVDIGDQVAARGEIVTSRSGELSLRVLSWEMASKCLRPLPDPHSGFSDPEARVRQRYLDLIVNPESMWLLQARSRAVAAMRATLAGDGFCEVETPMLQPVHGGATARPFRTHINAYNADLYLRIAPELYLKRLCVGGMGKIFELNRNFRNEGADASHNPEFTSLEAYQAHADYTIMRALTQRLIVAAAVAVHGEPIAVRRHPDGSRHEIRLDGEWPVVPVHTAVARATGHQITPSTSAGELAEICAAHGLSVGHARSAGELVSELYEALVEGQTIEPTFYTDFPVETSPLTRVHRADPRLSERWDLVAFGAEIGTAYSELIDPVDQRDRLTAQSMKAAGGDLEAMELDEAFLTALEYGMPPTGGLGLGVDRILMMLTDGTIRSTLAFPFVRT